MIDLRELNLLSILLRIFLAILVGGILGFERERKNRPAGFRTYILVCLGSALVMMTNQYVYNLYGLGDPVRMGAQVISGIVIVFIMSGLNWLDRWMHKHSKYIDLYIEYSGARNSFSEFLEYAKENHFEVSNIQMRQEEFYHKEKGKQKTLSFTLTVTSDVKRTHAEMIDILSKAKGIQYIEEV